MGDNGSLSCERCGKSGIVYVHEGRNYCPPCLDELRPPLPYDGPERRRGEPNLLGFTRRSEDLEDMRSKKKI
jgi:hypothetical protein